MRSLLSAAALVMTTTGAQATAMPSYSCVFTEPFISVDSFPGGVRYETPEGAQPVAAAILGGSPAKPVLDGKIGGSKSFSLAIVKKPGSDGMSSLMRPYTGTLSGSAVGNALEGACLKYPDGTTPRQVTGVIETDTLNVRTKPSANGAIIARVRPGTSVWAFPETVKNGWARVAVAKFPPGEDGNVTIVTGYVRAKFLGGR
jgi:uncharacterized protein YgiM (DUF1202 family)